MPLPELWLRLPTTDELDLLLDLMLEELALEEYLPTAGMGGRVPVKMDLRATLLGWFSRFAPPEDLARARRALLSLKKLDERQGARELIEMGLVLVDTRAGQVQERVVNRLLDPWGANADVQSATRGLSAELVRSVHDHIDALISQDLRAHHQDEARQQTVAAIVRPLPYDLVYTPPMRDNPPANGVADDPTHPTHPDVIDPLLPFVDGRVYTPPPRWPGDE